MKPSHIDKLYSRLTPKEQACMVLEAAANSDEAQVDAVIASVERKQYYGLHADYTTHMQKLIAVVGIYGTEYWKNRALMLAACNLLDETSDPDVIDAANRFYEKAIALDVAAEKVCQHLGCDIRSVNSIIGGIPITTDFQDITQPDQELVNMYFHFMINRV
jgi:hypothetical protein